jgi:hypothetical protein
LDQLVLQRCDAEGPLSSVGLGDVYPTNRLRSIRPTLQAVGEVSELVLQVLPVLPPRDAVHPSCGCPLETEVSLPKRGDIIDVV